MVPVNDYIYVLKKVRERKRDHSSKTVYALNKNPILDTIIYEFEFPDRRVEESSVNNIPENPLEQVDSDGWDTDLLSEISHFALTPMYPFRRKIIHFRVNTTEKTIITTKGWDIQMQWEYQYTDWVPLILIKESNRFKVAEYAVANGYNNDPPFRWWVSKVLKKRSIILTKVKSRFRKPQKYKFGVQVPIGIFEAKKLDDDNGNTLWKDSIKKDMEN